VDRLILYTSTTNFKIKNYIFLWVKVTKLYVYTITSLNYPDNKVFILSCFFYLTRTFDSYSYELEQLASSVDGYRV
jgi:hypothetical protein